MHNLATYTGKPGQVRIGGKSADQILYDENMTEFSVNNNYDPSGPSKPRSDQYTIGPRFLEAIDRLPNSTSLVFTLNLAHGDPQATIVMAQAVVDKLTNIDRVSFEIGNEPDHYTDENVGYRSGKHPYTPCSQFVYAVR